MLPLKNIYVTCKYGWRIHPITKKRSFHHGVDLRAKMRTEIYAIADGAVILAGRNGGYGQTVKLDHGNGIVSMYAHCSWLNVRKGDKVTQGRVIALSGNTGMSTGPHLHFGIYVNGGSIDPLEHSLVKEDEMKAIKFIYNGKPFTPEEPVVSQSGKTLMSLNDLGEMLIGARCLPVRSVMELLGKEVTWQRNVSDGEEVIEIKDKGEK